MSVARAWILAIAVALLAAACGTTPPTDDPKPPPDVGDTQTADRPVTGTDTLQRYLDLGREKVDQGAIAEGILSYVTVLSELQRMTSAPANALKLGVQAEEELNRIGSGLSLGASVEWIDAEKNQVAASTFDVGTPQGRSPAVTLTYSIGNTAAVVVGAPVVFEFIEGSGTLVTPVTTNEFGQANTTVTSLQDVRTESIVRATVVFRVGGYAYPIRSASRDFAYLPAVRKATILVLEKAILEDGTSYVSAEPVVLDRAYNVLRRVEFDYTPYNGRLLDDRYLSVFGGDNGAIRELGIEEGVSYLVMVLSDTYYVKQVELNGRKYQLHATRTNGTTRVIRVADGAILYSGTVQAVEGQGNTAERAVIDGFRNTAERMADKLTADLDEIRRTLLGT